MQLLYNAMNGGRAGHEPEGIVPMEPFCIWDLEDDPDGNVMHIAEHGVTPDEVEDVMHDPASTTDYSGPRGGPFPLGWTETGRYLAVVWESVSDDPRPVYPVTAYDADPPA